MSLKYEQPPELTREGVAAAMQSGDSRKIVDAILSSALYGTDWRESQDLCLRALGDERMDVRRGAVLSLGDIARVHGRLDLEAVLPELQRLKSDPDLSGTVEDTLDDIKGFVPG